MIWKSISRLFEEPAVRNAASAEDLGKRVALVGRLVGKGAQSPLTREHFMVARVQVDERVTRADVFVESDWLQLADMVFWAEGTRLRLESGDEVDLAGPGVEAEIPMFDVGQHPALNDGDPRVAAFLRSVGVTPTLYAGHAGNYRFREGRLEAGAPAIVDGTLTENAPRAGDDPGGYRGGPARVYALAAVDGPLMVRTPRP